MKENFVNNVTVRGYIFSHSLQQRVTGPNAKQPNTPFIMGDLNVAVDEDGMNVIPVHFTYVTEFRKNGNSNSTYTDLLSIINGVDTYEKVGVDAVKVRINGDLEINDFYNRNGELVSAKRVRGGFLHFITPNETLNPCATFETDMLAMSSIDHEVENGEDYLELKGYVFNFRKDALPVSFSITSEAGRNFFESMNFSPSEPYFGKVWGNIINTTVVSSREVESEDVGFGQPVVTQTTRSFRTWQVDGANVGLELDDDTITLGDIKRLVQERETRLADLKAQTEARLNGNNQSAFPEAKTSKKGAGKSPTENKDYVF